MLSRHNVLVGLTAFSSPFQAAEGQGGVPWWMWVLIVLVLAVVFLWWRLYRWPGEEATPTAKETTVPDDLKRIEGIGPKISEVLEAGGITTFAQLAAVDVDRLRQILAEVGLAGLADPGTWPDQADLAAAGKWDALEALQSKLKWGRRV